jgi:hypothetical protein
VQVLNDQAIELKPDSRGEDTKAEIVIAGRPTGRFIEGVILEAALDCEGEFVLFVTNDTPFEESLAICLIDGVGSVLDSLWIGAPYATGSFRDLVKVGPDTAQFRFAGDTDWTLQILPRPQFAIPYIHETAGVWRPFGFRRRLMIKGNPKPGP